MNLKFSLFVKKEMIDLKIYISPLLPLHMRNYEMMMECFFYVFELLFVKITLFCQGITDG